MRKILSLPKIFGHDKTEILRYIRSPMPAFNENAVMALCLDKKNNVAKQETLNLHQIEINFIQYLD